jgi:long-subunit fatty acid transport protein
MKSLKTLSLTIIISFFSGITMADYNPSNNNSATQFKTGNRNASIGMESAFYNPAGTVFGKQGFAIEFSVLPFTSKQSIFDSGMDKKYESKSYSYFYPALNLSYVTDKFSIFSNIGITNGGGAGNYDDGLPQFERLGMLNVYNLIIGGVPMPSNNPFDYSYQSSFKGSAYGIGGAIGAAYKFTDWLSTAVALQYSYQQNHQEGFLTIGFPGIGELSKTEIDADFTGSNLGFIFGLNVKPNNKLLIAQTFRYYTELELETEINDSKDGDGLYIDGAKMKNTYVPYYSLGVSYQLNEKLKAEADLNVALYSMLDLEKDVLNTDLADYYNNGVDFGLGLEYQITEMINWGIGFSYAPSKMKKEYMSEMEFETNSLWFDTGATVSLNEKYDVNLSFQAGVPTEKIKQEMDYGTGSFYQEYSKQISFAIGLGLVYRF